MGWSWWTSLEWPSVRPAGWGRARSHRSWRDGLRRHLAVTVLGLASLCTVAFGCSTPQDPAQSDQPSITETATGTPASLPTAQSIEPGCDGTAPRVCLVPLSEDLTSEAGALVEDLHGRGLAAGWLSPVSLSVSDFSTRRRQLIANRAEERVAEVYRQFVEDRDVTVIAVAPQDMFIEGETFDWVFGFRGDRVLVISTFRMDDENWGYSPDPELRASRLRKMLLRYVGLAHLGLEMNDEPLTVLYRHLDGLDNLDVMQEGVLQRADLPEPDADLEAWAQEFCAVAEPLYVSDELAWDTLGSGLDLFQSVSASKSMVSTHVAELSRRHQRFLADIETVPLPQASNGDVSAIVEAIRFRAELLAQSVGIIDATLQTVNDLDDLWPALEPVLFENLGIPLAAETDSLRESVSLVVWVALQDAAPCGEYEPAPRREAPAVQSNPMGIDVMELLLSADDWDTPAQVSEESCARIGDRVVADRRFLADGGHLGVGDIPYRSARISLVIFADPSLAQAEVREQIASGIDGWLQEFAERDNIPLDAYKQFLTRMETADVGDLGDLSFHASADWSTGGGHDYTVSAFGPLVVEVSLSMNADIPGDWVGGAESPKMMHRVLDGIEVAYGQGIDLTACE